MERSDLDSMTSGRLTRHFLIFSDRMHANSRTRKQLLFEKVNLDWRMSPRELEVKSRNRPNSVPEFFLVA
jgi:hypothetical protein